MNTTLQSPICQSAAPALATAKNDLAALLDVLGLTGQRAGNHHPCRYCGNKDALSVSQSESGWRFKCHSCQATGSIVDALALAEGLPASEVCKRLAGPGAPRRSQPKPAAPVTPKEPAPPVPDLARLNRLFEVAFLNIIEGRADRWLAKRGITRNVIEAAPNLGFVERADIKGWTRPLENAWLIRVCLPDGQAVALKAHRENPQDGTPKSLWLPFGLQPAEKPRHGFATLWPPPEWFSPAERLFITEGELKAAALISCGKYATAPTTGADFRWHPWHTKRLAGRRVCIVWDDDEAGRKFRDNTTAALRNAVSELRAVTFGRKVAP